jgi:hypothetical protein
VNIVKTDAGNYYCPEDPGEVGMKEKRLSVTAYETKILAAVFRGKTVLEFGTGLGVSTRAIASTAKHVYTFDPDPWVAKEVAPHLPPNVTFSAAHAGERADGAFVDGHHSQEAATNDIKTALAHTDGGPILIHDSNLRGVQLAILTADVQVVVDYGGPCQMVQVVPNGGEKEAHREQHGV